MQIYVKDKNLKENIDLIVIEGKSDWTKKLI